MRLGSGRHRRRQERLGNTDDGDDDDAVVVSIVLRKTWGSRRIRVKGGDGRDEGARESGE